MSEHRTLEELREYYFQPWESPDEVSVIRVDAVRMIFNEIDRLKSDLKSTKEKLSQAEREIIAYHNAGTELAFVTLQYGDNVCAYKEIREKAAKLLESGEGKNV